MSTFILNRILLYSLIVICLIWLVIPFGMAILWSLVDPAEPWTPDRLLPPVLSFYRWENMWENSSLKVALVNSYVLAPTAAIITLIISIPTSFALGRINFPGKEFIKLVALLPLVVPGFVTAIFFSSLLIQLGLTGSRFAAIVLAHTVIFLPYAIRIMTVSFEQVRDDHINAARDLGASTIERWKVSYIPALKPGIMATLLIVFIQSIEEFAIAFIIGIPDLITIPTLLYSNMGQDFVRPNAAVLALILVVPNIILMLFLEKLLKSANPSMSSGKG